MNHTTIKPIKDLATEHLEKILETLSTLDQIVNYRTSSTDNVNKQNSLDSDL